jgi:phosphoglycolate phosphatase
MVKLVVFDLDGTLVNSLDDLAEASNYALISSGYPPHEVYKYKYFVGDGAKKLCERILPESNRNVVESEKIYRIFSDYYDTHYTVNTNVYDGINEMIVQLSDMGIKMAVASNKPHKFTEDIISYYFKSNTFDFVLGNSESFAKKPSPDILNYILASSGISKEETLMIGDTNVDILTAKNAGVKSVGCLWGFRTIEELENAEADYIISHPMEIVQIIEKEK